MIIKGFNAKRNIVFFIFFLNCIFLSIQDYKIYNLKIPLNTTNLEPFFIEDKIFDSFNNEDLAEEEDEGEEEDQQEKKYCTQWVPSLISPISLVHRKFHVGDSILLFDYDKNIPFLQSQKLWRIQLYSYKLNNEYNSVLSKIKFDKIDYCYFGISSGLMEYDDYFNETLINLNVFKNNFIIDNKTFSFDNWTLDNISITSKLYFGDTHPNFKSNDGIIGTCDANKEDPFWGCFFKRISFKDKLKDLTNDEGEYYKIFFSSENHNIIIPNSFHDKFMELTEEVCKEEEDGAISCIFDDNNYLEMKLIDEEKMNITIELDNMYRYILYDKEMKTQTRIIFGEEEYFILPLIMFKRFYVKFDAENYKVSFYTTDESILQIKKEKKGKEKSSSKAGTVILVIFIIILILGLGFGVIWLIRRRRNSIEKNINKYNKFEDEENFQDMNEKRVF